MSKENIPIIQNKLGNTLFFPSIKNEQFDYTLPLKASIHRFSKNRSEVSPSLFEYLCYKIAKRKYDLNELNNETAIITEKFLTSKTIKFNTEKINAIHKPYIFIPILNEKTQKWNAVLFINLERQIVQYMSGKNSEPIFAKIISSNYESDEDDVILNTTMDKLETAFNFTSPDNIQFEVDSINISDQPNTSIFLLNFIEGLICQPSDKIFEYIMKLYDQNCNNNLADGSNYFVSFNRENDIFNDLINTHQNEMVTFFSNNNININQQLVIENNIENEENNDKMEALINDHSEQMGLQNLQANQQKFGGENCFGIIQEVENESEDESEQISKLARSRVLEARDSIGSKSEAMEVKKNKIDENNKNNNEVELLTNNDKNNKSDFNYNEAENNENNENQTTDDYINVNNNPEEKNDEVIFYENQPEKSNEKIVDSKNNNFDDDNDKNEIQNNPKIVNEQKETQKENLLKNVENIVNKKKESNNKNTGTKITNQKLNPNNIQVNQDYTNIQTYISNSSRLNGNLNINSEKNNLNDEYVNLINIPEDDHSYPIPILNTNKSLVNLNTDNSVNTSKDEELSLSQLYNERKKYNTENEIKLSSSQLNENKLIDDRMYLEVKAGNELGGSYLKSKSDKDVCTFMEKNKVNNEKLRNKHSNKDLTKGKNVTKIHKNPNKNITPNLEKKPGNKKPRTQYRRKFITNNNRRTNNISGNKLNKDFNINNKLTQDENDNNERGFEKINKICESNELHDVNHELSIQQKRNAAKSKLKMPPRKNNSSLNQNNDEIDDFKLSLSRDLNCGCVGDFKNVCNIF